MPLKMDGDPGYGSLVGPGLSLSGSLEGSETLPLLIPEAAPDLNTWKPMNREQLEAVAGGPGWRKFRSRLVLLFWLGWLTMLGTAIAVVIQSPRPVATPLHWWQKELFYRLQPALFLDVDNTESSAISKVSDRLDYLRSLGVGVMILEGLFRHDVSPPNLTEIDQRLGTLPQFYQLITDCHKAGVRIILDLCNLDLLNGPEFSNKTEMLSDSSVQDSLRYWLVLGVSGFGICDTDSAFSEKTLTEWRGLVEEFNIEYNERIVMVKQTGDSSSALNASRPTVNSSLVDLVSESLLPSSFYQLSAAKLAEAMETRLKTLQGEWSSWTVDRPIAWELQKVFMVLIMTLPGTPIIRYGDEISQPVNQIKSRRSTSLFQSLSRTRFREEALLFGTFTFLPFNSSAQSNSSATPPLAFLRSWGCVHVLVLFNLGSEPQSLDPNWAPSLPEEGVFVTSTGLDRLGAVSLQSIKLHPHEAIVIKLFEPDNYF
ncbi:4F2 cell-surface antigen heavy chain [Colossoma macropomum]|uniref:4F2 cell-surface antigen heavy chain n=1 Tax=Colossoma macropomum TaxID=42526 RepID=UPI00186487FC|nr:4F2 cell-surface antigen heavy chain [Colossoma macropomum]